LGAKYLLREQIMKFELKSTKEGLVEGLICYDGNLKFDEINTEWERLGLGKFIPERKLSRGTLLFHATIEDIILCANKIREGYTEIFISVGPNRKFSM
jgi:hypothetical protein